MGDQTNPPERWELIGGYHRSDPKVCAFGPELAPRERVEVVRADVHARVVAERDEAREALASSEPDYDNAWFVCVDRESEQLIRSWPDDADDQGDALFGGPGRMIVKVAPVGPMRGRVEAAEAERDQAIRERDETQAWAERHISARYTAEAERDRHREAIVAYLSDEYYDDYRERLERSTAEGDAAAQRLLAALAEGEQPAPSVEGDGGCRVLPTGGSLRERQEAATADRARLAAGVQSTTETVPPHALHTAIAGPVERAHGTAGPEVWEAVRNVRELLAAPVSPQVEPVAWQCRWCGADLDGSPDPRCCPSHDGDPDDTVPLYSAASLVDAVPAEGERRDELVAHLVNVAGRFHVSVEQANAVLDALRARAAAPATPEGTDG